MGLLAMGDEGADEEKLAVALEAVLDRIFSRFVTAFRGRSLVVPLSGGIDSRLVAAMLKRHGAPDVLCFPYGLPGNPEARASQAVARELGYDWEFVEYSGDLWANWMASEEMERYWEYAMQGCVLPLFQDLPAVNALTRAGRVERAFLLPAFEAVTTGMHLPMELYLTSASPRRVARAAIGAHFRLWVGTVFRLAFGQFAELARRVELQLAVPDGGSDLPGTTLYEMWEHDNRQGEFIADSARGYEFCGRDWAFPLCDDELEHLYLALPVTLRWHRRLYVHTIGHRLFTGDFQRLREIPLENGQSVLEREAHDPSWLVRALACAERTVVAASGRLGLAAAARKARYGFVPARPSALGFEHWFANGGAPGRVRVRDALARLGIQERLQHGLWRLLEGHLSRPLADCQWYGLLSAISLAHALAGRAGLGKE